MSQNVTVQGASYSDVPGVQLPITGGGTAYFVDTSDANATAADIDSGKTAYVNGVKLTGTGSGGGGGGGSDDDVRYIDYDGTVLHQYSKADFLALSAHPSNPSHTGLTAQGWNWTLSDAQTYVTTYDKLIIGQQYATDDGSTRVYITVPNVTTKTMNIAYRQSANNTVTVDWGDGNSESFTGTSYTVRSHTYASAGNYVVSLSATGGTWSIYSTGSSTCFLGASGAVSRKWVYKMEFGSTITDLRYVAYNASSLREVSIPAGLGTNTSYAFSGCYPLKAIVIPNGTTKLDSYFASSCWSLSKVSLPKGITALGSNAFYYCLCLKQLDATNQITTIGSSSFSYCQILKKLSLPNISGIPGSCFSYCYALEEATVPASVSLFGSSAYDYCENLKSVTIPSGITTIQSSTFRYCVNIENITIPSAITSLGTNAFSNCASVKEYHIKPTTPPTLSSTNTFNNISSICKIYVPSASLATYKATSNWSNYADYMVGE